ncbi:MAG: putative transcriptional regulator, lambda repressor-like DNA-binding domain [Hyphomicrobiales bacterium]|jgi:probable addiction module antidote protein|nr:putative transcriptional regulator, lambda repressor-like DNA-binding domain [Hyphomicrobiales bacterium]
MPTKTIVWDTAEALRDDVDIAEYLNAAVEEFFETDDVSYLTHALGVIARARGMSDVAKAAGVGRESLYRSLSGDGNPSFATVARVLRSLGVTLHVARL